MSGISSFRARSGGRTTVPPDRSRSSRVEALWNLERLPDLLAASDFVVIAAPHTSASVNWEPIGGEEARSTFAAGPGTVSAIDRAHLHVRDCTLGIVGLGSIGREIALRGSAFGMRVLAVDPIQSEIPTVICGHHFPATFFQPSTSTLMYSAFPSDSRPQRCIKTCVSGSGVEAFEDL